MSGEESDGRSPDELWTRLCRLTPARIGLGRAGSGLPTREVLRFGLAHAQARDAVHTAMDIETVERAIAALGLRTIVIRSQAADRAVYLRRPDLGRRLAEGDQAHIEAIAEGESDLAIVVADGLSARAVHEGAAKLVAAFLPYAEKAAWRLAPVVLAAQARVALGDPVGAALRARAVAVLIGERPGLSSPDSLGIYLTFAPRPGRTDAERNCISNLRPAGLGYDEGAFRLAWLLEQALARGLTGVILKDGSGRMLQAADPAPALAASYG